MPFDQPIEKLGESSRRRGFLIREPVPALRPSSAYPPRRNTLTRVGFLCGFPMIFLLLATDLWATERAFTSGLKWEHAIYSFIFLNLIHFVAFLGGIVTIQRRKGLETAHQLLLPALQSPPGRAQFSR